MRFTLKSRTQRAAAVGVVALSMLAASGCSAVNDQATTQPYSPSDGIVENLGDLQLRNIMVASNGDGDPGRLLGTLVNGGTETVTLDLEVGESDLSWTIPAGGKVVFEDAPEAEVMVASVEVLPGTGLKGQADIGSESTELNIPVVDASLEEYAEYVPSPTPEATEPTDMGTATMEPTETGDQTGIDTGTADQG
ncbi:hypothetical protein BN1051_00014 [Arthrobacter saudimassiliensis]|uniref:Uncharacterized protein n=1 Tax=Arthrobacter saudimassiliensis TaxID=1461584 RepID=A0A078MJV9_9MICC|nr:hypothetical protein BN1051_00014 [Arthrobacter saudimassiliensis]